VLRTAVRPLLATLVLAAGCLMAPAAGAARSIPVVPSAACPGTSGVTVVVDFASWGGTQTRCASGNPESGFDALSGAGFPYTFVPNQPGLVCTISQVPDPCNGAPADAYWSYWHAQPGGSWTYSNQGAGFRDPAPGSVEGWAFGAGGPPSVAPPPAAPASTTTTTSNSTTTTAAAAVDSGPAPAPGAAAPPGPASTTTAGPGTGDAPSATTTTRAEERRSTTTTRTKRSDGDDERDGLSDDDTDDRDERALIHDEDDGGDRAGVGALVGLGAAAALLGSALHQARRRRAGP
jgi:hypothetical protein